jgi:hypothetical protein
MPRFLALFLFGALAACAAPEVGTFGAPHSGAAAKDSDEDEDPIPAGTKATSQAQTSSPGAGTKLVWIAKIDETQAVAPYGDTQKTSKGKETLGCLMAGFTDLVVAVGTDEAGNVGAVKLSGWATEFANADCKNVETEPPSSAEYTFSTDKLSASTFTLKADAKNTPQAKGSGSIAIGSDTAILDLVLERTDAKRAQDKWTLNLRLVLTKGAQ